MPELVHVYVFYPCPFSCGIEAPPNVGEREHADVHDLLAQLLRLQVSENTLGPVSESYHPELAGLAFADREFAFLLKVHITPRQIEQLGPPQAGVHGDSDNGPDLVIALA